MDWVAVSGFNWDDMRVFLAVQRGGSLRAAASGLGMAQSTVSRRLEGLETALGARLFHRMPKGLLLSETGEAIMARIEGIEGEMLGISRDVLGRDATLEGRIVISMPPPIAQFVLMSDLVAFGRANPGIDLVIHSSYAAIDLSGREADIAIRFGANPEEHLVGRRLPDFGQAAYATPDYLASHVLRGDRANAEWIGWDNSDMRFPKWVRNGPFPNCPVRWRIRDIGGQVAAAEAGQGLALLPCVIGDRRPQLVRVPPGEVLTFMQAWILTHADLRATERVRVCLRFLANAMAEKADALAGA